MQVFHNKLTQSCHLLWKETLSLFCPDKIKIMNNKQICSLLQRLAFHKKAMTASALEMCRSIGVPLGGNWPPVALNTGEEAWCFMATIGTEDQTAQHLLLLLLRRFSHVRLCATPETAAHQAPRPWDSPGKNTGVGCHFLLHCVKMKSESEVAQSRPTHSNPMDCSPPGSSIHGIFQARLLEWGAIAFSNSVC